MDKVFVNGMRVQCNIGWDADERSKPQDIAVDVELNMNLSKVGDDLKNTADHSRIKDIVRDTAENSRCRLLETFADGLAGNLLDKFSADSVMVRARKPRHEKGVEFQGVDIRRERT